VHRFKNLNNRWNNTKVLIIDEISMIDLEFFEKVETIARYIRNNNMPFGGIQVILCGDFFQLPPVFNPEEGEERLCFEAECWSRVVPRSFMLKHIFRQRDEKFIRILSEVRMGTLSEESITCLKNCVKPPWNPSEGSEPTRLFPHRRTVEELNMKKLNALKTMSQIYEAKDFCFAPQYSHLFEQMTVPKQLTLRVGAQVILLKNIDFDQGLVNGAVGIITDFTPAGQDGLRLPIVLFRNGVKTEIEYAEWAFESGGEKVASRSQVPLNLAWALSIHKSQGMTLSNVEMSIEKVFAEGQAYVALSRVVSLSGLRIIVNYLLFLL